MSKHSYSSQ